MPTYSWKCSECGEVVEVLCKIAERDNTPTEACMCEEPQWKRTMEAPNVVGKASYLDGNNRFAAHKEAAKLQKESRMSRSKETRKEIAAEIRKLGVRNNKEGV